MLLKAEFEANKSFIEHSQEDMLEAGEKLMSCQKLQDLFYMVLMAGNFLNSVSHHLFRIIAKYQNIYHTIRYIFIIRKSMIGFILKSVYKIPSAWSNISDGMLGIRPLK